MPSIKLARGHDAKGIRGFSASTLHNFYAESNDGAGRSEFIIKPWVGLKTFANGGMLGNGRGVYAWNGALYAVIGEFFCHIGAEGQVTPKGSILGTAPCIFSDNNFQIKITADNHSYVFSADSQTVVDITGVQGAVSNSSTYFFERFIDARRGKPLVFTSAVPASGGGGVYTGGQYSSQNLRGEVLRAKSVGSGLWLFAENSYEILGTGDPLALFPFAPQQGTHNAGIGLGARHSVALAPNNTLMWVGQNRIVYVSSGYGANPISTRAIEEELSGMPFISDAEGFVVNAINGHIFYVLSFPAGKKTFVYDATEEKWFEVSTPMQDLWRARGCAYIYGKYIVADRYSSALYELDPSGNFFDNGNQRKEEIVTDYIYFDEGGSTHGLINVFCETGSGADSRLTLEYSDDGGYTYKQPITRPLSPADWRGLVQFDGLGEAPLAGRVYRLRHYGNCPFSVWGMHLGNVGARRP